MTPPAPYFLTPGELADRLRVSRRTLADWRYKGEGPAYLRINGRVRYPSDRFDAWLAERAA